MRRFHTAAVLAFALLLCPEAVGRTAAGSADAAFRAAPKDRFTIDPERFKAQSANINLEVPDPMRAVADAERLVRKMGGEIQSSNGSADSAHLSAKLGERRLQAAVDAVRKLPGTVSSVHRNVNDFSQNARQSTDRLRRLAKADGALVRAVKTAPDADAVDGLMLLRELADQERRNIEQQIESLREQSDRAQLHVSFSRMR